MQKATIIVTDEQAEHLKEMLEEVSTIQYGETEPDITFITMIFEKIE